MISPERHTHGLRVFIAAILAEERHGIAIQKALNAGAQCSAEWLEARIGEVENVTANVRALAQQRLVAAVGAPNVHLAMLTLRTAQDTADAKRSDADRAALTAFARYEHDLQQVEREAFVVLRMRELAEEAQRAEIEARRARAVREFEAISSLSHEPHLQPEPTRARRASVGA